MALNFPDNPSVNQQYSDSGSGFTYKWNGTVWTSIGISTTRVANIRELDDISSGFDGSETEFTMSVGGAGVSPVTSQQMLISLGGVMQNPNQDFSVAGTKLTFTTAPISGLSFFGIILGTDLTLNTIPDGSVTYAKMGTGAPRFDLSGNVTISGVATVTSHLNMGDNDRIKLGDGADLQIWHDSGNSFINDAGTGSLKIQVGGSDRVVTNSDGIVVTGVTTSTGGFNIGIQSGGTAITTAPVKTLNFVGAGNTFAVDGTTVDVSIAGGGGGGGGNASASYFASGWGSRTTRTK
tara:strand:- start:1938 stop:2816 length:879 start_codon:yes stop_codon:yes gene_type:complete